MSPSRNRSDLLVLGVLLALGAVAAIFLTTWYAEKAAVACDGRVGGPASPQQAANTFLHAVSTNDEALACSVMANRPSTQTVAEAMGTTRQQLADAGLSPDGAHELIVQEQQGSVVVVTVMGGSRPVDLQVLVVSFPTFQTFYRVLAVF